jgi:hypothetical protein
MPWLRSILDEVYGLFVDDGSFAVAIVVWLGLAWLILPRIDTPPAARAPILFVGLVVILLESALRRARR